MPFLHLSKCLHVNVCISVSLPNGNPLSSHFSVSLSFSALSFYLPGLRFRVNRTTAETKADTHGLLSSQGHTHIHTRAQTDRPPQKRKITTMGNLPRTGRDDGQGTDVRTHTHTHTHTHPQTTHTHTQLCLRAKVLAMHHYPPLEVIPYPSMHFSCGEEITPGPC